MMPFLVHTASTVTKQASPTTAVPDRLLRHGFPAYLILQILFLCQVVFYVSGQSSAHVPVCFLLIRIAPGLLIDITDKIVPSGL